MTDTAGTGTTTTTTAPPPPATGADGTGGTAAPGANDGTETKPTDTVEFWKQKARENEKRAKDNSAAATELAALKAAQQTAEERLATERDAAKREADEARAETLRYKVATKFNISADDAETFLTGTDEDTLTKQAERLAALAKSADSTSPAPRPDLTQGGRPASGQTNPAQEFGKFIAAQLDKG
jgi:hypothetical protein